MSRGAATAVTVCMGVRRDEKVVILTDEAREHIGHAIAAECELAEARVTLLKIEDFVARPARSLPEQLLQAIDDLEPDVSFYAATGEEGELQVFRAPYMKHILYGMPKKLARNLAGITCTIVARRVYYSSSTLHSLRGPPVQSAALFRRSQATARAACCQKVYLILDQQRENEP